MCFRSEQRLCTSHHENNTHMVARRIYQSLSIVIGWKCHCHWGACSKWSATHQYATNKHQSDKTSWWHWWVNCCLRFRPLNVVCFEVLVTITQLNGVSCVCNWLGHHACNWLGCHGWGIIMYAAGWGVMHATAVEYGIGTHLFVGSWCWRGVITDVHMCTFMDSFILVFLPTLCCELIFAFRSYTRLLQFTWPASETFRCCHKPNQAATGPAGCIANSNPFQVWRQQPHKGIPCTAQKIQVFVCRMRFLHGIPQGLEQAPVGAHWRTAVCLHDVPESIWKEGQAKGTHANTWRDQISQMRSL